MTAAAMLEHTAVRNASPSRLAVRTSLWGQTANAHGMLIGVIIIIILSLSYPVNAAMDVSQRLQCFKTDLVVVSCRQGPAQV